MEHPIAQNIIDLLQQHNMWHEVSHHEPVRTSEESAALRDSYTIQQGAKALIVRVKVPHEGKQFAMVVVPGDRKFDAKKVKALLKASDIRFATEDEVATITNGVKPGGVPPFGNLFGLKVLVDTSLFQNERIVFNAGRTTSIGMRAEDYKIIVQPTIANIT